MSEFKMPSLGADMEKGRLVEWMIKPGDHVKRGDIVAVVDTQKAAVDVEIFEDGVVERLLVKPQDEVPIGTPMAVIRADGEAVKPVAPEGKPTVSPTERPKISPRARKLAHEAGIVAGVTAGKTASPLGVEKTRDIRSAVAAAMTRSKREIPHYYLGNEVDMTSALDWLSRENAKRAMEDRLIYAVLLLKALAMAVRAVPEMNGFWIDGELKQSQSVHVGVAISLRQGGLVAPAIHDVDKKDLTTLMRELNGLVTRARAGSLKSSEMSDPTITMTNLGEQGVDSVFGVIYPPQVALVGFGRISSRKTMQATLSGDHRASDGHRGALFLMKLGQLLQHPEDL